MITKAIVEDASNPCYVKVRIPTYDAIEDARGGTLNKDLSYATICALPNSDNNVQNGDVVFVSFEDDDLGKPVIIGHLVKEEKGKSYSDASFRLLNTKSTTTLYKDTYIGDVTPQEIASLKGIKFNIQEQFNNINTYGTYIPQGGTLTAPLTVTGGDGGGAGKLILDETTYGQITNKGTATLFGFISPAALTVGHSTFNLSLRGSQTNPTYNGTNVALTSDISTAISNAKLDIYPIGTVYICVSKEVLASSPASWLGGTWELLPEGYALWTTTTANTGGKTISAGLPNITGYFNDNGHANNGSATGVSGAFYNASDNNAKSNNGAASDGYQIGFDASLSNPIYGSSSTVQPPAYRIYAWKRTA